MLSRYFTVVIPFVASIPTEWHPTDPTFAPLTRGYFKTAAEGHAWAKEKGVDTYTVREVDAVNYENLTAYV